MPNPDSLGASPRFAQYTLDGSTDVDIMGDLGSPCRQIKLLSAASGNLTLREASPDANGTKDKAITITNLPAGDVLNVQATRIVGGAPSGLIVLVLCALAALLVGCATARDAAVVTLNGSADFAAKAEPALEELDRRDQQAIVDFTFEQAEARARLAVVRARYHKAWLAYRDFRASWLAAAASVRAYDDATAAKLGGSEADFVRAVAALVDAERALVQATTVIRDGGAAPAVSPPSPAPAATPKGAP